MKNFRTLLLASVTLLFTVFTVEAGTRVVVEVEVIEGDSIEKSIEIITFNKNRFRIDFPGEDKEVTDQTPYIMSVNGGENGLLVTGQRTGFTVLR